MTAGNVLAAGFYAVFAATLAWAVWRTQQINSSPAPAPSQAVEQATHRPPCSCSARRGGGPYTENGTGPARPRRDR